MKHFVDSFGEEIFKYFIVLFTRKDDLDYEKKSIWNHIETVPQSLQDFIEKCGRRVIAFNNRLTGEDEDKQVKELLSMIFENVKDNNGECYDDQMYGKAEQLLQKKEAEKRKKAEMERDKEIQAIKDKLSQEFKKEAEKNQTQTAEAFQRWQEEFAEKQREEYKAKEEEAQKKCKIEIQKVRDDSRKELEEGQGFLNTLWDTIKSIFVQS